MEKPVRKAELAITPLAGGDRSGHYFQVYVDSVVFARIAAEGIEGVRAATDFNGGGLVFLDPRYDPQQVYAYASAVLKQWADEAKYERGTDAIIAALSSQPADGQ